MLGIIIYYIYDDGFFGKINIILFGDLLQLPPVKANFPFVQLTREEMIKHVKSLDSCNLFHKFDYDELTINMRQKDDELYNEMLLRMRLGFITDQDHDELRKRMIPFLSPNPADHIEELCNYLERFDDDDFVCLLPTKEMCKALNDAMLQRIDSEEVYLTANDTFKCPKRLEKNIFKLLNEDDDNHCGIERVIKVKIGAKIMIRRNIDVSIGLVNGTIGKITSFKKDKNGAVTHINIKLKTDEEYSIEPIEYKFIIKDNIYIARQQFPICLSYGITIHKSQGISVKNAVVDAGSSIFTQGQTYVACSRVISLKGLHLINFDPSRIEAAELAIREYNRLRQLYRPDLHFLQIPDNNIYKQRKGDRDIKWTAFRNTSCNDNSNLQMISDSCWNILGLHDQHDISRFANVCIQSLFHCTTVRRILMEHSGHDSLQTIFNQYISKTVVNIEPLREYLHEKYTPSIQQDVSEFLVDLCEKSLLLQKILGNHLRTLIVCPGCTLSYNPPDTLIFILPLHLPEPTRAYELQELIDYNLGTWLDVEEKCKNNCKCKQRQLLKIDVNSTLLIVKLLLFTADDKSTSKITNFRINNIPKAKISIEKKIYKVISGIFHHGNSIANGHYTNMLRKENNWLKVYNSFINKKPWPKGAKDAYILFLERI